MECAHILYCCNTGARDAALVSSTKDGIRTKRGHPLAENNRGKVSNPPKTFICGNRRWWVNSSAVFPSRDFPATEPIGGGPTLGLLADKSAGGKTLEGLKRKETRERISGEGKPYRG